MPIILFLLLFPVTWLILKYIDYESDRFNKKLDKQIKMEKDITKIKTTKNPTK